MATVFPEARGRQAAMMERTGWSKATMSQLYNDKQDLNSEYIRQACVALNIREHELFMHPSAAMALRKFEETAREVAKAEPIRIVHDADQVKTGTGR
jgi:transcriptional regulator with XRE-family HTH domain